MLLSHFLFWSSANSSVEAQNAAAGGQVRTPRARGGSYLPTGEQGWTGTIRQLAVHTMLSPGTIGGIANAETRKPGALDALRVDGLIFVENAGGKMHVRVDPVGLAKHLAYDTVVSAELRDLADAEYLTPGAPKPPWHRSQTAKVAMKAPGIRTHFPLMNAVTDIGLGRRNERSYRLDRREHLRLRALSQVVNQFCDRKYLIEQWGFRWCWTSLARFAELLGVAESTAEHAIDWLAKQQLVYRAVAFWKGNPRTLLAPNVTNILDRMETPNEDA